MGFLTNTNLSLIQQACERVFRHKVTTSITKGPYFTCYEYQAKLRDASIRLTMSALFGGTTDKPNVTIDCVHRTDPKRVLVGEQKLSNPLDALAAAERIWLKICGADEATVGNLDNFDYFEYLDYLFLWIYEIRKVELGRGQLVELKALEDTLYNFQREFRTSFDLEEFKSDYCKLVVEKTIIARYTALKERGVKDIDDRLYLEARLLVESSFDGISQYKARRF